MALLHKNENMSANANNSSSKNKCISPENAADNIPSESYISFPHSHDVLLGRGSGVNHHAGNLNYRKLVKTRKTEFHLSKSKRSKNSIARGIVGEIMNLDPPGSFLLRPDLNKSQWVKVDYNKAVAKTSQALREGAPMIRLMLEKKETADLNEPQSKEESLTNETHDLKQESTCNDKDKSLSELKYEDSTEINALSEENNQPSNAPLIDSISLAALNYYRYNDSARIGDSNGRNSQPANAPSNLSLYLSAISEHAYKDESTQSSNTPSNENIYLAALNKHQYKSSISTKGPNEENNRQANVPSIESIYFSSLNQHRYRDSVKDKGSNEENNQPVNAPSVQSIYLAALNEHTHKDSVRDKDPNEENNQPVDAPSVESIYLSALPVSNKSVPKSECLTGPSHFVAPSNNQNSSSRLPLTKRPLQTFTPSHDFSTQASIGSMISLLNNKKSHEDQVMISGVGIKDQFQSILSNKRHKCEPYFNDPFANYIFNFVQRQQVNTPFANFLRNILLSQTQIPSINSPVFFPQWSTPLKDGDIIPQVMFKMSFISNSGESSLIWKDKTTEDLFQGKRIVLFAVPAAFNASCSRIHVSGFQEAYDTIISLDIDEVYCVSVNDACVMHQWFKHMGLEEDITPGSTGFKKVKMLPDGACHFTRSMGMSCIWDSNCGYGERSWRYSAVINNMKIERIFLEGGDIVHNGNVPVVVSDAHNMLEYLYTLIS